MGNSRNTRARGKARKGACERLGVLKFNIQKSTDFWYYKSTLVSPMLSSVSVTRHWQTVLLPRFAAF